MTQKRETIKDGKEKREKEADRQTNGGTDRDRQIINKKVRRQNKERQAVRQKQKQTEPSWFT